MKHEFTLSKNGGGVEREAICIWDSMQNYIQSMWASMMFNQVKTFRNNLAQVKAEVAESPIHPAGPGASSFSTGATDGSQESWAVGSPFPFYRCHTEA